LRVARVKGNFTMEVAPEQAQAMFVRDIAPDLAKDAELALFKERPGSLEFVPRVDAGNQDFDPVAIADPDVVGHGEEDEEPDVRRQGSRAESTIFTTAPGRVVGNRASVFSELRRWGGPRLTVRFAPAADGTVVTLKGSIDRDVRDALARLGTPGHWPATAGDPHD
jgi:hypothetical protein